jgi:hypothetical protein
MTEMIDLMRINLLVFH